MSLKKKLLTTIISIILLSAMLIVGVWAVRATSFQVGGNISFSATGIHATISEGELSDTGSWVTPSDASEKMKEIVLNTDKSARQIEKEFLSWQDLNLLFNEAGDDVTITFTITNNSTNAKDYIAVDVSVSGGKMANAIASVNTSSAILTPNGGSQEFVITFSIDDKKANASLTGFEIFFGLNYPTEASSTPLTFSYSDAEPYTASITDCLITVTEVNIPTLVTKDGIVYVVDSIADGSSSSRGAFYNCNKLTSIKIPDSIKKIGNYAFHSCDALTNVTIGNSVTSIGDYAFYGCSGLTSVTIGSGVTSIGNWAFWKCKGLTSVTIPNSVTSIGDSVFQICTGLTSVTIGSSVTSIGKLAFYDCSALKNINYLGDINDWASITFGNDSANPTHYTKSLVIQGKEVTKAEITSATKIGNYAFHFCENLSSVSIGNSVTSIGKYAFDKCYGLTSVTIGNGVTSIGSSAFYECFRLVEVYNLSSLNITKGSTNNGYVGKYAKDIYTSLSEPSKLSTDKNGYIIYTNGKTKSLISYTGTETELTLPSGITAINQYAFYEERKINSVTIPNSVTSIGEYAFKTCAGLANITLDNGVTSIGTDAFQGCSALENMNYLGNIQSWVKITFSSASSNPACLANKLVIQGEEIISLSIPDDVTSISAYAFYECDNITNATIGNNVTSIGNNAFYRCKGLTSVTIGKSVTSIGTHAFGSCDALTNIVVNENNSVFDSRDNCNAIINSSTHSLVVGCKNTVIPNTVTSIGPYAFGYCAVLSSITIPNSVTSISTEAFIYCTGLTSITLPNSLTSIGNSAFSNCTGLTSITIPSSVTNIIQKAFNQCNKMTTVVIDSETVASGLTGKSYNIMGNILVAATTVYIKTEIVTAGNVGDYVTNTTNFPNVETITSGDYAGYTKYYK